ncbi:MAG TPA: Crp/Fnr family transcriptional regulator, partial [Gammaproteobacteria bacterium]|nr:Crp/Fnr family transcriptional regulator [Gammaproteobacteria bacterium]
CHDNNVTIDEWLLAPLSEDDYLLLAPNLQPANIKSGQVFYKAYASIHYAYFIERDLVSAVSTEDGPGAEVAVVG